MLKLPASVIAPDEEAIKSVALYFGLNKAELFVVMSLISSDTFLL